MQIDFYSLATESRDELLEFVKRLVRQIYYKNLSIFIVSDSVAELHKLNDQLWDLEESDFLPHDFVTSTENYKPKTAITFLENEQKPSKNNQSVTTDEPQAPVEFQQNLKTTADLTQLNFIELGIYQDLKAKDVCINLSTRSLVKDAKLYNRLVEISIEEDEYLAAKREIWLSYKEANFNLKHHKIN